mmetsp:Transcript_37054/g.68410  ORF Transcript_37054/g.68410 Transcript_37054/m.68410 type:complete len:101 (-) Transcript_37054:73-375(-)
MMTMSISQSLELLFHGRDNSAPWFMLLRKPSRQTTARHELANFFFSASSAVTPKKYLKLFMQLKHGIQQYVLRMKFVHLVYLIFMLLSCAHLHVHALDVM